MPSKKPTPFSFDSAVRSFVSDRATRKKDSSMVPLEVISLPVQQPRFYFDEQAMDALVASIRQHGILSPLLVRPIEGDKYELVAGERRYRAAQLVGLAEVPVVIRELNNAEAFELALLENLQREDLNPVEETEGILELLSRKLEKPREWIISLFHQIARPEREAAHNVMRSPEWEVVEELFAQLGRFTPNSFRANRLPLLKLPEDILDVLRQGKIDYTKARAIARLGDVAQRQALLELTLQENLSLSEIRQRVQQLASSPSKKVARKAPALEKRIDTVYERLKAARLWKDVQKQKRLEMLLGDLEHLLDSDQ